MVWARFDDRYSTHSKIVDAGPWAELLDMRAIIYACCNETDGVISLPALKRISDGIPNPKARAARLVEVERWVVNDIGGGWFIHSFLKYNPSKAQLAEKREDGKKRAARSRERNPNGTGSESDPRTGARRSGISVEPLSAFEKSEPPWIAEGMTHAEWLRTGQTA